MVEYANLFHYIDTHANTTVLTVNRRLSQFLHTHYAKAQQSNLAHWKTPDILPYLSWQKRELLAPRYADTWSEYIFLNEADELIVWEKNLALCDIGAQDTHSLAPLVKAAWEQLRQWQVPDRDWQRQAHGDQLRLISWIKTFEAQCRQKKWLHSMQWIPVLIERIQQDNIALADHIVLVGFDSPPPQLNTLVQTLTDAGKSVFFYTPSTKAAATYQIPFDCTQDEYTAMAQWACEQVAQHPNIAIGCIVPNLTECREAIFNAFMSVAYPLASLPGQQVNAPIFNIAGGAPLAEYPIIYCALLCCRLLCSPLSIDEWQALLDSPYLAGANAEKTKRAILAHTITQRPFAEYTLEMMITLAQVTPLWQKPLQALQTMLVNQPAKQLPSQWLSWLYDVLTQWGWPGEQTLSSEGYQLVKRFWALLDECKQSDPVIGPCGYQTIATYIKQRCQHTVFQKQSSPAPIQIIGTLESAGLIFDQVWFMHCHSKQWPQLAKPNPLIPLSVQREYQLPHCSPERELDFSKKILHNLAKTTHTLYCSYACYDEDRKQHPSPLIADFIKHRFSAFDFAPIQALSTAYINAVPTLEHIDDTHGKPLTQRYSGGTGLLKDYAACPFRAYVRHRLGVTDPWRSITQSGFSPAQRGQLVHKALELAWTALADHNTLLNLSADILATQSHKWAHAAFAQLRADPKLPTSTTLINIELTRLGELVYRWLMQEKERAPFNVVALEKKTCLSLANLTLSMRLDRIDRLADGSLCVIDYKTGKVDQHAWFGQRPDDPQLPLYALQSDLNIEGIAFAKVSYQKPQFTGVLDNTKLLPGSNTVAEVKETPCTQWQTQVQAWQAAFTEQAEAIGQANAVIDPKNGTKTCAKCQVASICRHHYNDKGSPK